MRSSFHVELRERSWATPQDIGGSVTVPGCGVRSRHMGAISSARCHFQLGTDAAQQVLRRRVLPHAVRGAHR